MSRKTMSICGLSMMLGCAALTGCSTNSSMHADIYPDATAPAAFSAPTPKVNPEFAMRMNYNALVDSGYAIRLGAGDRFGDRMFERHIALVQTREANRIFAEVTQTGAPE